jgi:CheY-like chemotaxis protein
MTQRILLVDDEPNVLQGFKRHLRKSYEIELADSGASALRMIQGSGPFAVVVSDMQMPEMSGVELLSRVRDIREQTVRVMLTGNADQRTAVDAVNEGEIFRFLNKPCAPEKLAQVLDAALEQYRLITAEEELLNKTLSGSVRMLTQVLSMVMPEAFGLAQEARTLSRNIAHKIGVGPLWQIEMAAMLMRVGCVSLPADVLGKYLKGKKLTPEQVELIRETPRHGHGLLTSIPRLQGIADYLLAYLDPPQDPTPIASRILRAVGDFQRFRSHSTPQEAIARLRDAASYDGMVVEALAELLSESCQSRELNVLQLREGMVLESHIEDLDGRILVASGAEVHEAMIQKLAILSRSGVGVKEPLKVRVLNLQSKQLVNS